MKALRFKQPGAFEPGQAYRLLPFRFIRRGDSVLLTNEAGEFYFLKASDFRSFVSRTMPSGSTYFDLKSKHFLWDSATASPLQLLATKVRTKRSFLAGFTRLHIFVVTLRCDHSCPYCQVSRVTENRRAFDMSPEDAARSIEWVFRSPAEHLKIEFQGGEPTLNWELIEEIVAKSSQRAAQESRTIEFVVASNLATIDERMLSFSKAHGIQFSTSLDGPPDLHNQNRPRPGNDSHQRFRANLDRVRAALGQDRVSALMTTSSRSLDRVHEIIDAYVEAGFQSVFLRPISPYGFAKRGRMSEGYNSERFLMFYRQGLDYIIELNRRGLAFVELYSQILLRKILTPFPVGYVDLQSPAGAATAVVVYNYDGNVYAADEGRMLAEMGDHSFKLGNVCDSYESVMGGERVRALLDSSCVETMPGCSECAYSPYCGADPVQNWATQGDLVGHRPTSEFCRRQIGIFEHLFDLLRTGDDYTRKLLTAWAVQ